MATSVECRHITDGQTPLLRTLIGDVPVALCVGCTQAMAKVCHVSLLSHNADPSQGHGDRPPGGLAEQVRNPITGFAPPPLQPRELSDESLPGHD